MRSNKCSLASRVVTLLFSIALLTWSSQGIAVPPASQDTNVTISSSSHIGKAHKAVPTNPKTKAKKAPVPSIFVYRGTWISPNQIRKTGGILPNLMGKPLVDTSYSLDGHAEGHKATVFVSTTLSFRIACEFAVLACTGPERYIYQIKTTPNMIDYTQSGWEEEEFTAAGGILQDQIISHLRLPMDKDGKFHIYNTYKDLRAKHPKSRWIHNGGFHPKYGGLRGSGPQPQLLKNDNNGKCKDKTCKEHAHDFMNKHGAIVGWDGHFPLPGVRRGLMWDKRTVDQHANHVNWTAT